MQKEIEKSIKDLEAHFAFLANEASNKAAELSEHYKKIEATSSEIEKNNSILTELKKRQSDLERISQSQTIVIAKNNREILGHQKYFSDVLHENDKQKESSLKELQKINQWILDAKEEQSNLAALMSQTRSEAEKNQVISSELLKLKDEVNLTKEVLAKTTDEVKTLRDEKHQMMQDQIDSISDWEKKVKDLEERAVVAEAKEREFMQSYQQKMKDLAIYETRVKEEYAKAFPDRTIK